MTDKREPDERATLAAEEALRLLTGADHAAAATDPNFADDVARWRGRLAPLAAEVDSVAPPAGVWARIEAAIISPQSNVVILKQRLNVWRGIAGGATALAATLAGVLLLQPRAAAPPAIVQPAGTPMVAMLGDEQKQMKVMASWDPAGRQLVLVVAGDMPADPAHAHELWVIPAGGKPRSLGTMGGAKQSHMRLADALATLMENGATVAISVEPPGGSPTGSPTGPVIASGALTKA